VTRGALRAIAVPVVVQTTPDAPPHVRAAAAALAALLPQAQHREDADLAAAVRAVR
jgi:hypothetical protein